MSRAGALQAAGKAPEMERGAGGRFSGAKGRRGVASQIAREILEQPKHLQMLKKQARNGVGREPDQLPPATHKILMEYAYGAPPPRRDDEDEALKKLETLREEAKKFLKENPDQARVIDISAQRAMSRALPERTDDKPGA